MPPVEIPPPDEEGEGEGGDSDEESNLCMIGRWTIVLLLATATLLMLAYSCPVTSSPWQPWAAAAAAALAVFLTFVWYFTCHPSLCEALRLAWEYPLVSALCAAYLAGCCLWLWWIAAGFVATAMVAYAAWEARCHPDPCTRLIEWLFTLGSAAAGMLSVLANVSCGATWVLTINALVVGFLITQIPATCLGPNRPENPPMPPDGQIDPPNLPRRRATRRPCGCK